MSEFDPNNQNTPNGEPSGNGYYYRPYNGSGNMGGGDSMPPPVWNQMKPASSGMATASLVLGIIGILLSCCCCGVGIAPAIVGLILALCDRSRNRAFSSVSLAGLITSIIALVIGISFIIILVVGYMPYVQNPELFESIMSSLIEENPELIV